MASKLELRFTGIGLKGSTFTVNTGRTYTFEHQRLGVRQVAIGPLGSEHKPEQLAQYFKSSFNQDDNLSGDYIVTYSATGQDALGNNLPAGTLHGIVTIEHFDNTHFDTYANGTGFIDATLTTTTQETSATLTATITQADTNPCGNYKLSIDTNVISGRVVVEAPIGTPIREYTTTGNTQIYEIVRFANATTGIIKLYNTEFTVEVKKSILFNPPPVLSLINVDVQGSPFGAVATIESTSGLTKTYSFDGITYSGSNQLGGLLAGSFTAYVKDNLGCTKSKSFVVTEADTTGNTVPKKIEVPLHNSMRFADRSQVNFLGEIAEEGFFNAPQRVYQDWITSDIIRTQFRSSHPVHTVKLYGCGSEETVTVIQKSENINRLNIYAGNYTEKEGRLAVYFTSGNIYESDGITPKAEGHILNGRLPVWYKAGVCVKIDGVGVIQIERLLFENDTTYAITQLDAQGTTTNVPIWTRHVEHPFEWFEFDINMNRAEGNYIVEIDYGDGQFVSEVQRVNENLPKRYRKMSWRNLRLNDTINYSTGIKPFRRVKTSKDFTYIGQNESERHQSDETIELINSTSKAVYELELNGMTMELCRGLCNGNNHAGEIEVDGAVFITNSPTTPENNGNWYTAKCELALIGQTIESLEADYTQINVEFLKVNTNSEGVGFLQV